MQDPDEISTQSVQIAIESAKKALVINKYDEAISFAIASISQIETLSHLSRSNRCLHPKEKQDATIVMGVAKFHKGALDEAAELLATGLLPHEPIFTHCSNDELAVITCLSVLGSLRASRGLLVKTLTSFSESACRNYLDSEIVISMRDIGNHVLECRFNSAIQILEAYMLREPTHNKDLQNLIRSNFVQKCIAQYVSCYEEVSIADVAREFSMPVERAMVALESMIATGFDSLDQRRIDMQSNSLVTFDGEDDVISGEAVRNLRACVENIELLSFRQTLVPEGKFAESTR
jgi:hypothetical protein